MAPINPRRRAVTPINYGEQSDDSEDNIHVGSSTLLDKVDAGSEPSDDESEADIRCVCQGTSVTEKETGRAFIQCDNCGVWQHMKCVGLPDDQYAAPETWYCKLCRPDNAAAPAMSPSSGGGMPVRSALASPNPTNGRVGSRKSFDPLSYYNRPRDLSVKDSSRRVSFSSEAKAPSDEDDEDGYHPPSEDSDGEEDGDDYVRELNDEESTLFVQQHESMSPTPSAHSENGEQFELAKIPRKPDVTDLGQSIVRTWISGSYAEEIDASFANAGASSDTSSVDIPDMSEGVDLLEKLAEQDRVIFGLKKKLERRGGRIARLKREVEGLRRENALLKGGDVMEE